MLSLCPSLTPIVALAPPSLTPLAHAWFALTRLVLSQCAKQKEQMGNFVNGATTLLTKRISDVNRSAHLS